MKAKLLKKIRQRYCIHVNWVCSTKESVYTIYDRFTPERYSYLDKDELFDTVLPDIYGSMSTLKIINKHKKNVKVRKIKRLAIANGYTEKDIPWLKN